MKLSLVMGILIATTMISFLSLTVSIRRGIASDEENKKRQMKKIETDLIKEKEQFIKFGNKEKNLLNQLSNLEKKIEKKKVLLEAFKRKIIENKRELKVQRERLNRSEHGLRTIEDRLNGRLVAFYKYAKRGYVHLLATSTGLEEFRKRIKYLKIIMDEDLRLFKQMVTIQVENKKEMARINDKIAAINQMEQGEREQLASVRKDMDDKVIFLMKIHQEKEFHATVVEELQLTAQDLKNTLLSLDRKQGEKKALPTNFEKFKGKLPLPIDGEIDENHNAMAPELKETHKGIFIKGPTRAEVKAIFPGRVDFSGWLKGYGQIIVINHGSRFFTISAQLAQRDKEKGEMVQTGDVIGLLGPTGSLQGPSLYFEIRQKGENLDPFDWLKVN